MSNNKKKSRIETDMDGVGVLDEVEVSINDEDSSVVVHDVKIEELNKLYANITHRVICNAEFITQMVGGQPASDEGLEAFCRFHLKLPEEEIAAAVKRIKNEEIGENKEVKLVKIDTHELNPQDPEFEKPDNLDELKEREAYAVNVIRRDDYGPWIGNWMIKACLKCAASRLKIFVKKRGAKGDLAELGTVRAFGDSAKTNVVDRVHLYLPNGENVETDYHEFMGSVQSPNGRVSIKHHSEVVDVGTRFMFELMVPAFVWDLNDIKDIFSVIGQIGIGSVKAQDRGKFKIVSLMIYERKLSSKQSNKHSKKK